MGLRVAIQRKNATTTPLRADRAPETEIAQPASHTSASAQLDDRDARNQESEHPEQGTVSGAGHDFAQIRIIPELAAPSPPMPPSSGADGVAQRQVPPESLRSDTPPDVQHWPVAGASARYGFDFGAIAIYPPSVQRTATETYPAPSDGPEQQELARRIQAASGSGSAIDAHVQRRLANTLSADLSAARVHTDSEADTLARSLNATAFTSGPDIFFRAGTYQPQSTQGMQLIAHEATHVIQQSAGPVDGTPAPGGISLSDPADPFERAADRQAAQAVAASPDAIDDSEMDSQPAAPAMVGQATMANGLSVQRAPDGAATPGGPSFQQMNKPPATGADLKDLPPRNDIELIGVRLKARQIDLGSFLKDAKADVDNIKGYFKWVTDVYDRSYGHYDLLLKQANEQAETQQQVVDLIFGVVLGVAVGALSEVTLGALAADTAFELLAEVAAEGVEGGLGIGAAVTGIKPEIAKAKVSDDLNPAFKKIMALQKLDEFNSAILKMAIPGPLVYTDPITQSERLSAELRVAEAHGERRMSDLDIRQAYLKLMHFDLQSLQMENVLKAQQGKFDALRAAYMGKQAPTDLRTEQDIWIQWLAKQNPVGAWWGMLSSIVVKPIILNHLTDIDMVAHGSPGGRLHVDVQERHPSDEPAIDPTPDENDTPAARIVSSAKAFATTLPAFWNDVFLMGPGGKK